MNKKAYLDEVFDLIEKMKSHEISNLHDLYMAISENIDIDTFDWLKNYGFEHRYI